ncbi:MAG TPA: helicase C-terminal domain-containing protein [Myxococcota bacterium]|nr:helicase C-terminal domain-containing protein [Myxococcota bacterium]
MLGVREQDPAELGLDLEALSPWLDQVGPVAVVDFETTGFAEDAAAEPIEFGAVLLDPGRSTVRTVDRTLRPQGRVPRSVRALTGIADVDLGDAPRIEDVARAIADLLAGRTIVAHNASFERHFLARYVAPSLRSARYLDTTELLAFAFPDSPDLRLETAAERLFDVRVHHRALPDAISAARLLSLCASGARAGSTRYGVVRTALERYAPRSPWLGLLRGGELLPAEEPEPAQYIRIPDTREAPVPFDADAIAEALADEERGRRHFPGYRVREGQIQMAREFVRVLDEGGRLLLEGGTGVGKSLAYLAALIPYAMERAAGGIREPLIVSTRTKLLQDQLLVKDIPAAAAMLGHRGLRALSIKGRANYVCLRRCQQVLAEGSEPRLLEEDKAAFAALACAAKLRPHGEIGTLPGALLALYPPLRDLRQRAVAARAEHCTREECATERACPFGRRRKALADAHLVVANHDLLLRWPPDYPAFTVAIVDEAHELAGVADEVYAAEVRPEEVLARIDDLYGTGLGRRAFRPRVESDEARIWRADLQADLQALGGMFAERAGEFGGLELPPQAARIFPQAAQTANLAAQRLDLLAQAAEQQVEREEGEAETDEAIARGAAEMRDAAASLRAAFADDARDEVVAAFENLAPPYDRWRLALRKVAPAPAFHESFLQKLESFAAVSASLFVGGDAFASLGELELERYSERPVWSLRVESPFPYEQHMRVVALDSREDLVEETAGVVEDLARLLGGRTLALFTSLRRMRDVRERLADRLRGEGFDLLMPRRATDDPAALVDRFARAGSGAVLLGSRTFWQGLDIVGPALSAVVIEKLPFEVPTELRRRREARLRAEGSDAFERQALGKMLLNLKQMVGRLIRSEDDRGLVVIVEPRSDRPYFERLGEALPRGCGVRMATRGELGALLDEAGVSSKVPTADSRG